MIPYTRSNLYRATQTGWPVLQMMPLAFPNDTSPGFYDMWNQFMFGEALLVAPVTTAGATSRSVYLPAGAWTDYNDRLTRYTGPTTITLKVVGGGARDHDPAGLGELLEAGGDVNAVAINVRAFDDNVA